MLIMKWDTRRIKNIVASIDSHVFGAAKLSTLNPAGGEDFPTRSIVLCSHSTWRWTARQMRFHQPYQRSQWFHQHRSLNQHHLDLQVHISMEILPSNLQKKGQCLKLLLILMSKQQTKPM